MKARGREVYFVSLQAVSCYKHNVNKEKSCGAVIYTAEKKKLKFILIQEVNGIWGFPKGHVEDNETEIETATREIWEETGLVVKFYKNFREIEKYSFETDGKTTDKEVVYFLARFDKQKPKALRREISRITLTDFERAYDTLGHERKKEILTKAQEFISRSCNQDPQDP